MPNDHAASSLSEAEVTQFLSELEVPFPARQVHWRVTNTSNDKRRGQIVPYADPRAYTDRLNALFTPQGWTRNYRVETMNNITRIKKGEAIVSGKVLVTCTVTIAGLGSHSGTGEDWADDDNGFTAADAQAYKRACCQFGLGRYFYDFVAPWVDLDQNRQPRKTPPLPAWAIPENWRKGMRPPGRNGNGKAPDSNNPGGNGGNGTNGRSNRTDIPVSGNGHACTGNADGTNGNAGNDLDARILQMETSVGTALYRNILREHGRVNQPKLIRDVAVKQKVLRMLESAARGICRLNAVTQRLDSTAIAGLLTKLQAPPLNQIEDMKTLERVVLGLEEVAGPNHHHAA